MLFQFPTFKMTQRQFTEFKWALMSEQSLETNFTPPLIKVLKPWNKGVQIMHDFRHLAHFHIYFANFRNMYWNIEAK